MEMLESSDKISDTSIRINEFHSEIPIEINE